MMLSTSYGCGYVTQTIKFHIFLSLPPSERCEVTVAILRILPMAKIYYRLGHSSC